MAPIGANDVRRGAGGGRIPHPANRPHVYMSSAMSDMITSSWSCSSPAAAPATHCCPAEAVGETHRFIFKLFPLPFSH